MTLLERLEGADQGSRIAWRDVALAVVAAALSVASVLTQDLLAGMEEPNAFSWVLLVGASACLAFRRAYPLGAVVVGATLIAVPVCLGYPEGLTPFIFYLLIGSMAAHCEVNRAVVGLVFSTGVVAVLSVWAPYFDLASVASTMVIILLVWALGAGIRWRLESARSDVRAAEQLAEAERLRADRAVAEERLRIAQELHDVVAHSMSVIAVQAGMGSHLLADDPQKARGALDAISDISRSTLTEMRRLLSQLRSTEGLTEQAPAPSLQDVPALVDELRAAGLPVDLRVEGEASQRHPGVELSAYRLVQESLTNVMKHAGTPTQVTVTVKYLPSDLSVEITDDGRGLASRPTPAAAGTTDATSRGHGLIGMRERVAVWGGELSTGPRPGGGYRVRAIFPYGGSE